jgi:hypothetical protein
MATPEKPVEAAAAPESKTTFFTRTTLYPMTPRAGVPRNHDITKFNQHRCHPRLADTVYFVMSLGGLREFGTRVSLLAQCYRSEKGSEPTEPFILDPAEQLPKLKAAWRNPDGTLIQLPAKPSSPQ